MDNNFQIFNGKSYSNLLEDIYNNSKYKRTQVEELIFQLRNYMVDPTTASVMAPIIKEVLSVSVRNDEQLVKLAQIVQRMMAAEGRGESDMSSGGGITDEEKQELLKELESIQRDVLKDDKSIGNDIQTVTKEIAATQKKYGISVGSK